MFLGALLYIFVLHCKEFYKPRLKFFMSLKILVCTMVKVICNIILILYVRILIQTYGLSGPDYCIQVLLEVNVYLYALFKCFTLVCCSYLQILWFDVAIYRYAGSMQLFIDTLVRCSYLQILWYDVAIYRYSSSDISMSMPIFLYPPCLHL